MKLEITCMNCNSLDFIKRGEYASRYELEQIYECQKCHSNIYIRFKKERIKSGRNK